MNKTNVSPDDYISLESFKHALLNLFRIVFKLFDYLRRLVKKDLLSIVFISLVGGIVGYLAYALKPVIYGQSMILSCNTLTKRTYYEMFAQLNNLATTKSYGSLSRELGLNEKTAGYIHYIHLEGVNGEQLENDTSSRLGQSFKLVVETSSDKISDSLERGLLSFVNNHLYLTQLKEEEKQIYLSKISYIDQELLKLDSLEQKYMRSLGAGKSSPTFYVNAFNPADIYVHSLNLLNQKQDALKWLNENHQPVYVVDGFKPSPLPKSIHLIRAVLIGLAIGFILSFLVAIMSSIRTIIST